MSATCSNCGEEHDAGDVFCEKCGFDFLTGSLPEAAAPVTSLAGPDPAPLPAEPDGFARITVDPEYHARMDTEGVLTYPDPQPGPVVVPLTGDTVLVGRARPSRGLFPDIDLSSDPAVSSRHAVLERGADGSWTITDLGSTNGTYLGSSTEAIAPDVAVPVMAGTAIYLGAWTRIDLS